jgi:hypothetical protein
VRFRRRAILPVLVMAVLIVAAFRDHYFRDEFYYLACSHRMAWGYVDQPPLSIALLWILRHAFGESLIVLRCASAMALGAVMFLTASVARRLGGGPFAELLAMVGVAMAPEFLSSGGYYSMNIFDLLLWTAAIRIFIELIERPSLWRWALLGGVLGLGLLNKISILWLGAGILTALVLTRMRRQLLTPGPYVCGVCAALLFLPHVLWQVANHWPTLEFMRNAASGKMVTKTPWSFLIDQVMNQHPLAFPLWGAGLLALLWHRRLRQYRALAFIFLTVAAILIANGTSRSGYLALGYPMLLASGAVFWEGLLVHRTSRVAIVALLLVAGAMTLPFAVPLLPVESYVRYSRALGVAPSTEEKKELGRLPQFFADRQGWDAFVSQVRAVWDALPPGDRERAAVLTGNYGEAGAIERLAGGAVAISGHNNYWLWGPQGRTGEVMIVLSRRPERLQRLFAHVEKAGETACGDCMPYENGLGIYVCRDMHTPLPLIWGDFKHYE